MLTGAVCRLNTEERRKQAKKDISLQAINEYAFARKNPIREVKASSARVTEIIILLKCLSHGKLQRLNFNFIGMEFVVAARKIM